MPDCRHRELSLEGLARAIAGLGGRLAQTKEKARRGAVGNLLRPSSRLTVQRNCMVKARA